jgi:hypothetical protein
MHHRSYACALALAGSWVAACGDGAPGLVDDAGVAPPDAAALIEDAWAVAVSQDEGEAHRTCSGALIGPHAVLTRAECASRGADALAVLFGPDARFSPRLSVARVIVEPERGELAMLVLRDAATARPAELAYDGLAVGDEVGVIGYGLSPPGASILGVERHTRWEVAGVVEGRATLYTADVSLCWGDLGAPVVDARGRVVALIDAEPIACRPGTHATAGLLDGMLAFLDQGANVAP